MNATTLQAYALEKGVNFNWNTASNAEKAELAIKMFMERTSKYAGNFAKESQGTFQGALGAMTAAWKDFMGNLTTGGDVRGAFNALLRTGLDFAKNVARMLGNLAKSLVASLPDLLHTLIESVAGLMGDVDGLLSGIGDRIANGLPALFSKLVSACTRLLPRILEARNNLLNSLFASLTDIVQGLLQALPSLLLSLVDALLEGIPLFIDAGIKLLSSLVANLPAAISNILQRLPALFGALIGGLLERIPRFAEAGFKLLTSLVTNLPQIIAHLVGAMPQIIWGMVKALANGIGQFADIGRRLIEGLWQGIKNMGSWLWGKVSGFFSNIWGGIKDFFGIHSPSRKFAWMGQMMNQGLAQGIVKHTSVVQDAMDHLQSATERELQAGLTIGIDKSATALQTALASGVASQTPDETTSLLQRILTALEQRELKGDVLLDSGALVGHLVERLDEQLAQKQYNDEFGGGRLASLV